MTDLIKNNNHHALSAAFETPRMAELLESASSRLGRETKFTKKTSFAPSSFYSYGNGVCPRYWFYAFHGEIMEYENTARQRANMDSGTAAGERIANLYEEAGMLIDAEYDLRHEDPPIHGYIDLIVDWQDEEMIGEVKTTKAESWNIRQSTMKAPGYQLIQLLIYMYVMKRDKGFFVIENKNTHELLVIPVKMNEKNRELTERVLTWMREVKANSDTHKLPKRPFTRRSPQCKSCPVQKACWDGFNGKNDDLYPGVVDLPPLEVPK